MTLPKRITMKYYIEINNNSECSYSIEELINLGIKKDTFTYQLVSPPTDSETCSLFF